VVTSFTDSTVPKDAGRHRWLRRLPQWERFHDLHWLSGCGFAGRCTGLGLATGRRRNRSSRHRRLDNACCGCPGTAATTGFGILHRAARIASRPVSAGDALPRRR